jgi:hypothetical protein
LLLEEGYPEGALQDRFESRMKVGNGLFSATSTYVGMHRATLNGAGSNKGNFNNEVVEATWLDARQGAHLGSALDLEDPYSVSTTQQVIDRIFLGQLPKIKRDTVVFTNEVHHSMERFEHAKAKQVKLYESNTGTVIFVPLQHTAPWSSTPLDRTNLHDGSITNHHAR